MLLATMSSFHWCHNSRWRKGYPRGGKRRTMRPAGKKNIADSRGPLSTSIWKVFNPDSSRAKQRLLAQAVLLATYTYLAKFLAPPMVFGRELAKKFRTASEKKLISIMHLTRSRSTGHWKPNRGWGFFHQDQGVELSSWPKVQSYAVTP